MHNMRISKFFITKGYENGLYYGKNGSSRFVNQLYYAENDKNKCFLCFFWKPKKQKSRPQELKSVTELIEDPLFCIPEQKFDEAKK